MVALTTFKSESRQIELPPKPAELSFETRRFPVGVPDKPVTPEPQNTDGQPAIEPDVSDTVPLQQEQNSTSTLPGEDSEKENIAVVYTT